MKIASKIKPRDGNSRSHTIGERRYVFARFEDPHGDVHYVADVHNESHAAIFLQNGGFYSFAEQAQVATLNRATGAKAPGVDPLPPKIEPVTVIPPELLEEATSLVSGSVAEVGVAVAKVSSLAVVKAAIQIEGAKQVPRKTVIDLLNRTLEGAAQAGVKV
jgi:hypothetical protein